MERWLLDTWYGGTRRGLWLLPLAWLFGAVVALRRLGYRRGWLRAQRIGKPVIVVGNLTVGGTGKTPLTLWLARRLAGRGLRVGIVSRGYGGRARTPRRVAADADPAEVGDEPALLAAAGIACVAIGRDRPAAAALLAPDCDVILADDGLQHYALARDAEIALVDASRGLGNGWLLPAGPLREPARRLAEVDLVVATGNGPPQGAGVRMRIEPQGIVPLAGGERRPIGWLRGRRVHAIAAIGNPGRFFDLLRAAGAEVIEHPLPDHHVPAPAEIRYGDGLPVLMTSKDAVKCRRFAGSEHAVVEVEASFDADDAARLDVVLGRALARASKG